MLVNTFPINVIQENMGLLLERNTSHALFRGFNCFLALAGGGAGGAIQERVQVPGRESGQEAGIGMEQKRGFFATG